MAVQNLPVDLGEVTIPVGGFLKCDLYTKGAGDKVLFTTTFVTSGNLVYYVESGEEYIYRNNISAPASFKYTDAFSTLTSNYYDYTVYVINRGDKDTKIKLSFKGSI